MSATEGLLVILDYQKPFFYFCAAYITFISPYSGVKLGNKVVFFDGQNFIIDIYLSTRGNNKTIGKCDFILLFFLLI